MYKSCPKWLFWVHLDANKHFHSKSRPNFWWPQRKFARGQKLSFLRNDPMLPYFMSLMLKNSWYFQNILLYFWKWQICPLFVSRPNTYEWVSESLKCTNVAVNDFVGCIWMQTKNFSPKNYSELQRNFRMFFEKWPQVTLLDVEWVELS